MKLNQQSLTSNYSFLGSKNIMDKGSGYSHIQVLGISSFYLFFQVTFFCQSEIIFWYPLNVWLKCRFYSCQDCYSRGTLAGPTSDVYFRQCISLVKHSQPVQEKPRQLRWYQNWIWGFIFEDGLLVLSGRGHKDNLSWAGLIGSL